MTEFDDGELEYGEEDTGFSINLYESADVGDENSYRLYNAPGENQRQHIIQQGKPTELIVQGDLYAVVHGTLTPRGKDATLIVLQFTFAGSEATKRRFRKIWIRVELANWDEKIGGNHDPEVRAIAPEGEFNVGEESTAEISTVLMAGVSAPVMQGIVELSASVERGKTTTRTSRATVYGGKLIAKRRHGKQNAVLWKLTEDDIGQTGVPRYMRSAILVVPQTNDGFELHVDIDATVDTRYAAETKTRRMMGKAKVDPVFFSDEKVNFGPKLKGVDPDNLGDVKLSELCFINTGISM